MPLDDHPVAVGEATPRAEAHDAGLVAHEQRDTIRRERDGHHPHGLAIDLLEVDGARDGAGEIVDGLQVLEAPAPVGGGLTDRVFRPSRHAASVRESPEA